MRLRFAAVMVCLLLIGVARAQDDEGRLLRGANNFPKAIGGAGEGALIGGLAGGGKGALIGAAAGGVVSLELIHIAAVGPGVRLGPGSHLTLLARAGSGPAQAAPSQPAAASQPDLKAVKADFVPGEKTIFLDDFTDMAGDEPPPHWKVRGGAAALRVGGGIRQLTVTEPRVLLTPNLTAIPSNFTMEAELRFNGHDTQCRWSFREHASRREVMEIALGVNYDRLGLWYKALGEVIAEQQIPTDFSQPVKVGLWIQNGRLRFYVNGQRIVDVNQITMPELTAPEVFVAAGPGGRNEPDRHVGFRFVRFAESAPDFSKIITSSGRYVTHGILFDTGSDRIKPESAPVIRLIAQGLETNPNLKLQIEGHTDSTGNAAQNMDLSKRRAEAVKAVLVSQFNVDAGRLTTAGLGSTKPIDSNDTPTGRAQNRRVEFARQ